MMSKSPSPRISTRMAIMVGVAFGALAISSPAALAGSGKGCTDKARAEASQATMTPAAWRGDAQKKTAAPAATGTIVDVAVGAGSFQTLVAAVQAAGLVETLNGPGPFTVFAPTDAAFAKLGDHAVQDLLKPENKAKLVAILTYHVVPGKVMAADLAGKTVSPTTVQGTTVQIDGRNGVTVDGAKVIQADVAASNGVIHVIDTVLMP